MQLNAIFSTEAIAMLVQNVCFIILKKTVKYICWEISVVTENVEKDIH